MATNYVQDGMTIPLINTGATDILSGSPVVVGDLIAVAITTIPVGVTGDGFARGVWQLPKLAADDIPQGKKVYLKDGKIQLSATGGIAAGVAWAAAGASSEFIAVRING